MAAFGAGLTGHGATGMAHLRGRQVMAAAVNVEYGETYRRTRVPQEPG